MEEHIIRQYCFDITYDSRPRAFALQDKVSMLFRQSISTGMDELLQQLIPADMMASIDKLVLNIGHIPFKDLEAELPARILSALQQVLSDLLHHHHAGTQYSINGDITIRKGDERLLELLTFFLLQGVMPWWATAAERAQPGDIALQLSKTSSGKLAGFIREIGRSSAVRERIVWQFPVVVLQAIVEVLEPAEALFIIAGSREILLLQQQQQLLQTESSELEKALWLFMLTYLIMERGSNFNRREFVRSNLLQLARHFNLSYDTVLELFYEAVSRYHHDLPPTGLASYIQGLYEELTNTAPRKSIFRDTPAHQKIMADTGEQISLLRYYLLYGAIPWWAPGISVDALQQLLKQTSYQAATALKQMLQQVLQQPSAANRWNHLMQTHAAAVQQEGYLREIKNWGAANIAAAPFADDTTEKRLLLRDVILHLLTYGSISWWGKAYAHFSLNSLLEQLCSQQPEQTLTILEYAGTLPEAMQRLLAGVKPAVFFRLLKYSGMDTAAEEIYDNVYTLLSAVQQLTLVTTLPLEHFVLRALWESLAAARYQRVSKAVLLQHLLTPAWSSTAVAAPHMIRFLLQQLLPAIRHLSGSAVLANDLQEWDRSSSSPQIFHLPVVIHASPGVIAGWLQQFLLTGKLPDAARDAGIAYAALLLKKSTAAGNVDTTALSDGRYHVYAPLLSGTLSGSTDAAYAAHLLQWLYEYHREYLKTLQDNITLSPLLFRQLEEIFLQLEPHIAPIAALLQPWLEKTMQADATLAEHSSSRLYQPTVAFRSLLQRMQRYAAITTERQQQALLEEARQLVTMFLTRYRLPEALGRLSLSATNDIIKAAVVLLFKAAPATLQQLFVSYRQQPAARMQIYGLFSFYAGVPDSDIRQSLDVFAVQDSLLLLQETAGATTHSSITDLRKAIRFYKQRSRQERKLLYSKILQHPALIEQMAQHLDDDAFLDMMQDTPTGWAGNTTDALHELQQLLAGMLPGSQEKLQLQQVFRRFHLMLLGAHIHVYDARSYATRFLDFLGLSAPAVAGLLMPQLARSAEQPVLLSYTHIRHVLPVLQQQAQAHITTGQHRLLLRESLYEKDQQQVRQQPAGTGKRGAPEGAGVLVQGKETATGHYLHRQRGVNPVASFYSIWL